MVPRKAYRFVMFFDPMNVAKTTGVLMTGIAIVPVLEWRLCKCE